MTPKDNDELRDYEQYVHWQFVALLRSLRLSANLSPTQDQLIKAKARLVAATIGEDISTHVVRAQKTEHELVMKRWVTGPDHSFGQWSAKRIDGLDAHLKSQRKEDNV